MDRLTSMNVFVTVAESGSFAAAAGHLQISPQMVAKHIAMLEKHLGTLLLHRTTRRQSLTDVGRNYFERCKIVLAEVQEADAIALDMQQRPSGTLKVSAPVTFGSFSLAPFVTRYLDRFPETQVDLELSDRLVDPFEEGYEVVIRIGALADSSIIAHPLQPYRLIACASPAYLARHGVPATPAELVNHACLVYGIWSPSNPAAGYSARPVRLKRCIRRGACDRMTGKRCCMRRWRVMALPWDRPPFSLKRSDRVGWSRCCPIMPGQHDP